MDTTSTQPDAPEDFAPPPAPASVQPAPPRSSWAWRFGIVGLIGALVLLAIGLGGVVLARYDIIDKLSGFMLFMQTMSPMGFAGLQLAAVVPAIGLLALLIGIIGKSGPKWPAVLTLLMSLGMLLVVYTQVMAPGMAAPRLHDITTNVADPPQFATLSLREDNLIPFASIDEWRAAHRTGYPDIAPIIIERSPAAVLGSARVLAEERGWEVADVDQAAGKMEATAFAGFIRFRDDVIVQVTPIADGSTRVDMRSVSRVGLSDLGYNAKRIEEFLGALQAAS